MSNDKHTPTPWEARGNYLFTKESKRSIGSLHRMNFNLSMAGTYMPCKESDANAARIVQCVNEYDGLIAKIELLKDSHREYLLVRSNLKDLTKDYNAAQSELESLQAEKAELIEALKQIEQFSDIGDGVLSGAIAVVRMKSIASQTLAKYETK